MSYRKPIRDEYYGVPLWYRVEHRKAGDVIIVSYRDERGRIQHEADPVGGEKAAASLHMAEEGGALQYLPEDDMVEILDKLDHMVLSRELHEQSITIESDMGERLISNQGVTYIHLTPEMLAKGNRMQLGLTTEEAGDEIRVKALSPVRGIGGIPVKAKVIGVPAMHEDRRINLDLPMWQAYEKPSRPQKKKEGA